MSQLLKSCKDKNVFYLIKGSNCFKKFSKVEWLFDAKFLGAFKEHAVIGPKRNMITPFSTNVCEILNNLGYENVSRVEKFYIEDGSIDSLTQERYNLFELMCSFGDEIYNKINFEYVSNIEDYNELMGLALSEEEIQYLNQYSLKMKKGIYLTDAEVFGFSQVNSEHCRHKIFNGQFIINKFVWGKSLFDMIRNTTEHSHGQILSAYSDNVAFIKSPPIWQFSVDEDKFFNFFNIGGAISLKAETHNFPTTVCAFPGAATGSGGEIRDRMGGGIGSIPGVGIAGYLTPYARVSNLGWENNIPMRTWKYQDPAIILIRASDGASDYGNKFGQPLIAGTVTTFEYKFEDGNILSYDKVIMLAGGVGHTNLRYIQKKIPSAGDKIILLGGDNYRIGIGGGSVSSLNTGECSNAVEENAVQRANPEMQNRVNRVIRTLVEDADNPIKVIHDHGAGGHFNCLSELVKNSGAFIDMNKLPLGDTTLTDKEILCNESQERMAIIVQEKDVAKVVQIAEREQCPVYVIGICEDSGQLIFYRGEEKGKEIHSVNLPLDVLFKDPPKKKIICRYNEGVFSEVFNEVIFPEEEIGLSLFKILRLIKVASKEWLTHKVDRSVTGLVAQQQTVGLYQLPLADVAVKALDYVGDKGIAIGIGDRPIPIIVDVKAGVQLSVGEALTNILFAPLEEGLDSVVLSANWMWPCGQLNEDARLYMAVNALSEVCIDLGIPVPTGKDSLSMTQKYDDGIIVKAPGTVIVTATGVCSDINKVVTPDIKRCDDTCILCIPFQDIPTKMNEYLGTSALAQVHNQLGGKVSGINDTKKLRKLFNLIQDLIKQDIILAGHDVSEGGILTALVEMAIAGDCGLEINNFLAKKEWFYEGLGILIQVQECYLDYFWDNVYDQNNIFVIARPDLNIDRVWIKGTDFNMDMNYLRQMWSKTSFDMDKLQMNKKVVVEREQNIDIPMKSFKFPKYFNPIECSIIDDIYERSLSGCGIKAAIIRDKGTNGDREMAYALYHVGFEVKDIIMTDIIEGREDLTDVNLIVFCGGFSNSDVLGSARGWAGLFKYNKVAFEVLNNYYGREDTLSWSVCNGNQLAVLLNLIDSDRIFEESEIEMEMNKSEIFESRFVSVDIMKSSSIFLRGLEGCTLGVWIAHKEGRYYIKDNFSMDQIPIVYSNSQYPFNPNGSDFDAAGICSKDGRHLMMMPHPERSIFPWSWAYYPYVGKRTHKITPWIEIPKNALSWIKNREWEK